MFCRCFRDDFIFRKKSTLIDPAAQQGNLLSSKWFSFRWHPFVFIVRKHSLNEWARIAGADDKDRSVFAALMNEGAGVEPKFSLLLQSAMAGITALPKDRFNVVFVICGRTSLRRL